VTRRTLVVTLTLGAAVMAGAACAPESQQVAPTDPCRSTIDDASSAAEISRQVELLDRALIVCPSVETFAVNAQRHPTMLGVDIATYLRNRCSTAETESVRTSRICSSETIATTTLPPTDVPDVVYVGTTLDGRQVEIRPRAGRPFDEGTPSVIAEMPGIALLAGCDGIQEVFDEWSARIDDPVIGDEASVYAQQALDVLAYIQCD
jgi:hypothetical protein